MLTEKTEKILCDLLMILSKGENSIRITRQILSNTLNYSPNLIFSFLSNSNQITDIDLYNYLIAKNINVTNIEAKLIILFYDKNMDDVLSFEEFIPLLNDKKNNNFYETNNLIINDNIEFLFNKILVKEIELCRAFLMDLNQLKSRNDFDIHKVFHYITDINYINYINKFNIEKFLQKNKIQYLDSDLDNIIKRLDINKDGIIDIKEFTYLFDFPKSLKDNYSFNICKLCKEFIDKYSINMNGSNLKIINNKNNQHFLKEKHIKNNNRYKGHILIKDSYDFDNYKFIHIDETSNKKEKTSLSTEIKRKDFASQAKLFNPNLNNIYKNSSQKGSNSMNFNLHKSDLIH